MILEVEKELLAHMSKCPWHDFNATNTSSHAVTLQLNTGVDD